MSSPKECKFAVRTDGVRRPPRNVSAGWDALCRKVLGSAYAITLIWTCGKRMREINRTYRDKDVTTNVLAFPLDRNYGEVFIFPGAVREEARMFGEPFARRATGLFIHALLHLSGRDHASGRAASRMEQEEEKLLQWYNTEVRRTRMRT